LTDQGIERAAKLGLRLKGISFAHVFCSPRQRARQTAESVLPGRLLRIKADLSEWDYGEFEGRPSREIHQEHPRWNLFRDGCPGGESPSEVSARADRVLVMVRSIGGVIACFSHGHFSRVLAVRWIGLPIGHADQFLLDTASVSILDYQHGRAESPAIALWNAVAENLP
jgi:probable phosphoglycerate mutase